MDQQHTNDLRVVRYSLDNSLPIPPQVEARLEARGVDVSELSQRLIETRAFRT